MKIVPLNTEVIIEVNHQLREYKADSRTVIKP